MKNKIRLLAFHYILADREGAPPEMAAITVRYTDADGAPLINHRLNWSVSPDRFVICDAVASTNTEGVVINHIYLTPEFSQREHVNLSVWPDNESSNFFEINLSVDDLISFDYSAQPPYYHGDLVKILPDDTVLSAPVRMNEFLMMIPGDDAYYVIMSYADMHGKPKVGKDIYISVPDAEPLEKNKFFYQTNGNGIAVAGFSNCFRDKDRHSLPIKAYVKGYESHPFTCEFDTIMMIPPHTTVNRVWPPFNDREEYLGMWTRLPLDEWHELRVIAVTDSGGPVPGMQIKFYFNEDKAPEGFKLKESEAITNEIGVAVTHVMCPSVGDVEVSYGGRDTITLSFTNNLPDYDRLEIIQPLASKILSAGTAVQFSVKLYSFDGEPLSGKNIEWTVKYREEKFDSFYSITDDNGVASNGLTIYGKDPGSKFSVTIKAKGSDSPAQVTQTYTYAQKKLVFSSPDQESQYLVDQWILASVTYTDADNNPIANKKINWSAPQGGELAIGQTSTNLFGIATNHIVGRINGHLEFSACDDEANTALGDFVFYGKSDPTTYILEIDCPSDKDVLPYDTWVPVKITLSSNDNSSVDGKVITWEGGEFATKTTTTKSDGTSQNTIAVETTNGPLEQSTKKTIKVDANEVGAGDSRILTFDKIGANNSLVFDAPIDNKGLPFDQWIDISVKLTNELGHPLGRYTVTWSGDVDIQFESLKTETQDDGTSNNKVFLKKKEDIVSKWIYADVKGAKVHANNQLGFGKEKGSTFSLVSDKAYAHNPKLSEDIDPNDVDQMVYVTGSLTDENGRPEAGVKVTFQYDPQTIGVKFFDKYNKVITPSFSDHGKILQFSITTDEEGNAFVKAGSAAPFLGDVEAFPAGYYARATHISIATISKKEFLYPEPIIPGKTYVDIPDSSEPRFLVEIPERAFDPNSPWLNVAMWVKGIDGTEMIFASDMYSVRKGVSIPYCLLSVSEENSIAYWLVDDAANVGQSTVLSFMAYGKQRYAHPDDAITDRPAPAPYLKGNAQLVNKNSIVGGLVINVLPYPDHNVGDSITCYLYLNGYDALGRKKFNVLEMSYTVSADDFLQGNPIVFRFNEEDLEGYWALEQIQGTFESDLAISSFYGTKRFQMSKIIGPLPFSTAPHSIA